MMKARIGKDLLRKNLERKIPKASRRNESRRRKKKKIPQVIQNQLTVSERMWVTTRLPKHCGRRSTSSNPVSWSQNSCPILRNFGDQSLRVQKISKRGHPFFNMLIMKMMSLLHARLTTLSSVVIHTVMVTGKSGPIMRRRKLWRKIVKRLVPSRMIQCLLYSSTQVFLFRYSSEDWPLFRYQ